MLNDHMDTLNLCYFIFALLHSIITLGTRVYGSRLAALIKTDCWYMECLQTYSTDLFSSFLKQWQNIMNLNVDHFHVML